VKPRTPRLRMFAGPNGSGKSCLNSILPPQLKGVYLNPDELEKALKKEPILSIDKFSLSGEAGTLQDNIVTSSILKKRNTQLSCNLLSPDSLEFVAKEIDSYLASALVEAMRNMLLMKKVSFTFETVMSHESKVDFLRLAKNQGYRTYLYYIATEDSEINISRVENRVNKGGHPVPQEKIRKRYLRSLNLLYKAIKASDRAYLFDNSSNGSNHVWLAEIEGGINMTIKTNTLPVWFETFVIQKNKSS